jgi:hypothetical protein
MYLYGDLHLVMIGAVMTILAPFQEVDYWWRGGEEKVPLADRPPPLSPPK